MKSHTLSTAPLLSTNCGKVGPSPVIMLAITPRWVLHHFSTSHPHADHIKTLIRERLTAYDQTPPHPNLKWYGQEDNFEWQTIFFKR